MSLRCRACNGDKSNSNDDLCFYCLEEVRELLTDLEIIDIMQDKLNNKEDYKDE